GRPCARRLSEEGIHYAAIGKRLLIEYFDLSAAQGKIPANGRLRLRYASRRGEKPFPEAHRNGHFLVEVAEQLAVQSAGVAEIDAHPLSRVSLDVVSHPERFFGRRSLQFVSQCVVIACVAVMQKTADRAEEFHGIGRKLFFRSARTAQIFAVTENLS